MRQGLCASRYLGLARSTCLLEPQTGEKVTLSLFAANAGIRHHSLARDHLFPSLTIQGGNPYNQCLSLALGGQMYAVIQTGGKQYRVAPGDTIRIERVDGKVGEKVNF